MNENKQITESECTEIAQLMERKYAAFLNGRSFKAESRVAPDGVYATITLADDSGAYVYPVQGRIKYKEQDLSPFKAAGILFDYIDLYFEEYLKGDDSALLAIDWADYSLEDIELQLKGQIINQKLEQMGDDWLAGRGLEDLH